MKRSTIEDIHTLTTAEIARQVAIHAERRRQIVNQRADLYAHALKNGVPGEPGPIDADEKAAREHAKLLLNGAAPAFLSASQADLTLDKKLYIEMRGIDIALKILNDNSLIARAIEAVEWGEAHSDEWRNFARELTIGAIKSNAMERRARALLDGCGDLSAVRLPMVIIANCNSISDIPIEDLKAAALADGILTNAEIRKAENVQ